MRYRHTVEGHEVDAVQWDETIEAALELDTMGVDYAVDEAGLLVAMGFGATVALVAPTDWVTRTVGPNPRRRVTGRSDQASFAAIFEPA